MRWGFMRTLATVVVLSLVGPFVRTARADKIVGYGASGSVGRVIVEEALSRGHEVIGVSRNPNSSLNAIFSSSTRAHISSTARIARCACSFSSLNGAPQ